MRFGLAAAILWAVLAGSSAGCAAGASDRSEPEAPRPDTPDAWERLALQQPGIFGPQVYAAYARLSERDWTGFDSGLRLAADASRGDPSQQLALGTLLLAGAQRATDATRRRGYLDESLERLFDARRAEPRSAAAAFNLGLALRLARRPSEALPHLESAAALHADDREAVRLLALCHLDLDEPAVALSRLERRYPGAEIDASDWELIGRCRYLLHQFERAEQAFRESLRTAPDRAWTWNNLGLTLRELARAGEADECFARSRALRETAR